MVWTDLTPILQSMGQTVMGEPVTYTPSGGAPESITGIFDGISVEIDIDTALAIQSTDPALTVRLASLVVAQSVGDAITVRGTNYTIAEIHPDGQGDARLKLEEV